MHVFNRELRQIDIEVRIDREVETAKLASHDHDAAFQNRTIIVHLTQRDGGISHAFKQRHPRQSRQGEGLGRRSDGEVKQCIRKSSSTNSKRCAYRHIEADELAIADHQAWRD